MNINSINVGLTGENLLSIYNDFVSIKEIDIKKVEINDDIKIIGSFSKLNNSTSFFNSPLNEILAFLNSKLSTP